MTGWHLAHLIALAAWGGLVLGEIVLEIAGRRTPGLRASVWRLHFAIDLLVELPLMIAVAVTGVALLLQTGLDDQLMLKVGVAIGALTSGLVCSYLVLMRAHAQRERRDPAQLDRLTRRIFIVAAVGLVMAAVAAWIGAIRVGWL